VRIARASALTDTGRRRLGNEDAFVCEPPLFAVADGMGGAQAGELASRIAAAALEERAAGLYGEETVAAVVQDANERIFRRSLHDPATAGMGTTVTVALVDEEAGTITIGHVGDSRAYRIRDGRLEQLTDDHSLVAELVRSGRLTQEEADQHPHRSVITRALGTEEAVEVDTHTNAMEPGDLYLICSDGLTIMVGDEEILAVLDGAAQDLDAAAEGLVSAANAAGGEDNVTVVLVAIEDGTPASATGGHPTAAAARDTTALIQAVPVSSASSPASPVRRTGIPAGGRLPALLLIVAVLALAALLLYFGVVR
jgi:PPM family protein phosphatase